MKHLILALLSVALLTGCNNLPLQKSVLTTIVSTGVAIGVEQHPEAIAGVRVAVPIVCSAANGTNVQPAEVIAAVAATGVGTNFYARLILNGALNAYTSVFAYYGADWVNNKPALQAYLQATCDGLQQGLPPTAFARWARKPLPPHIQ